jgi:RNA 3'-terminal phosphate cyclase (ATP)
MLTIDGSRGEGGGQILRSSLALALATGTPFRIERIRAGRARPGLMRQHLTALEAATAVGDASVEGAAIGSREVVFRPGRVRAGTYRFAVGTAGSAGLVLQTVLLPLATAGAPSALALEGGTHNPHAPPFDFLAGAFLPLLRRMGARVEARLERAGFYPAGGGRMAIEIGEALALTPLDLPTRGATRRRRARALVSRLPRQIGDRELAVVRSRLGWAADELEVVVLDEGMAGPGNVLLLEIESAHVTEVFTGFGEVGVRAEAVAEQAAQEARRYLSADVPVGPHLADQLLLPLALAGGGRFRTVPLTRHATTNIEVIRQFLGRSIDVAPVGDRAVEVTVGAE